MFKVFLLIVSFMVQSLAFAGGEITYTFTSAEKGISVNITGGVSGGTKQVNIYKTTVGNNNKETAQYVAQFSAVSGKGNYTVAVDCDEQVFFAVLNADKSDSPNRGPHFYSEVSKLRKNLANTTCKQDRLIESKNARSNDRVVKYELYESGDFFRIMPDGKKCQITTKVEDFKTSQHPYDKAAAYFEKDGDLYVLHPVASYDGQCPAKSDKLIVEDVKKYTIISNTSSKIVNITLAKNGRLIAWDNTRGETISYSVKDYVNNTCYGQDGKAFSSYVAFALQYNGQVIKLKNDFDVKSTSKAYSTLQDFKEDEKVCK